MKAKYKISMEMKPLFLLKQNCVLPIAENYYYYYIVAITVTLSMHWNFYDLVYLHPPNVTWAASQVLVYYK